MVQVLVDERLPDSLAANAHLEAEMQLRVPGGRLWVADPAYLHTHERPVPVPEDAGQRLDVTPGDYRASAFLLDPQSNEMEAQLRRTAGTLPVAVRDVLGIVTFFLGVLTVIGLPVYLIGRALDGGLAGAGDGLGLGLAILVPLWLVVLVAWRLPVVRRVDRADEQVARKYPDLVIGLAHLGTAGGATDDTGTQPHRSPR
jgi:hypothetical protein